MGAQQGQQMQGQQGLGQPPTPAENLTAQHGAVVRPLLDF